MTEESSILDRSDKVKYISNAYSIRLSLKKRHTVIW